MASSPYMSARDVALEFRIVDKDGRPNLPAVYKFLAREKLRIHSYRLGRKVLVYRPDIEACLVPRFRHMGLVATRPKSA